MAYAPAVLVQAPATRPHPFGLFSVAVPRSLDDPHLENGVEWQTDKCDPAGIYATPSCVENDAGTAPAKTYGSGVGLDAAAAFTVYGSFRCSPVGHWDDALDRARLHLETGAARAVEIAVSTGAGGASPALNDATTSDLTPTPGTAVDIVLALGLLESWIASDTTGGVLHLSPLLATLAMAQLLLVQIGDHLETKLGTPVVVGAGYDGQSGPNAVAAGAGEAWAFATGTPQVWASEPFQVPPSRDNALKLTTNDLSALAEQTFIVGWSCGTAGVLVDTAGA